jgi:hypothetical protein
MQRLPSRQRNSKIHRQLDMRALWRLLSLLACGLMLAGGFVYAAQQHFNAVEYGYKSETLRLERDRLLSLRQQLMLRREQAYSPAKLEAAARDLGLKPLMPGQLEAPNTDSRRESPARVGSQRTNSQRESASTRSSKVDAAPRRSR